MRQSMAKATRRDLRRAVGVSALDELQQFRLAIGDLGHALAHDRADVATLARDHALLKQEHAALKEIYVAHVNRQAQGEALTRTRWGRLRWMLGL